MTHEVKPDLSATESMFRTKEALETGMTKLQDAIDLGRAVRVGTNVVGIEVDLGESSLEHIGYSVLAGSTTQVRGISGSVARHNAYIDSRVICTEGADSLFEKSDLLGGQVWDSTVEDSELANVTVADSTIADSKLLNKPTYLGGTIVQIIHSNVVKLTTLPRPRRAGIQIEDSVVENCTTESMAGAVNVSQGHIRNGSDIENIDGITVHRGHDGRVRFVKNVANHVARPKDAVKLSGHKKTLGWRGSKRAAAQFAEAAERVIK